MRHFFLTFVLLLAVVLAGSAHAQIAVEADTVYTMAGEPIVNGVVLIRDGQIEQVGTADEISISAEYDVHQAVFVTPGLIDARSVVGLAGYYNIEDDQDQLDPDEIPALITAQQVPELMGALRLAEEFGFRLVLDGAAEAYEVLDEIRDADVPVIIHPPMVRAGGTTQNVSFETSGLVYEAGIPMAFQSGFEGYVPKTRVVLFEAAIAMANGTAREDALATLTIHAACLLEIDDRVGSLEEGKDADVVLFDGDPFEYTTRTCAVIINGEVASDTCR